MEFNYDFLAGLDHTEEVETPPSMPAQDSMKPCDHNSGKLKEASTDLSDSVTAPEAVTVGSVSKEMLLPQAGNFFNFRVSVVSCLHLIGEVILCSFLHYVY